MPLRPGFRRRDDDSIQVRLPAWLRRLLGEQLADLDLLLRGAAPPQPDPGGDPLEQLIGRTDAPAEAPDDPVLRRLRPDGYAAEVDAGVAAADFRRFTGADLAALQRQRLSTVREGLSRGDRIELSAEEAEAWLGALNDLRLALGTRLGVTEDPADWPGPGDPQAAAYQVYGLLGHLQDMLIEAIAGGSLA